MPVDEQQKTLNAKLRGHYQYYGRPTNYRSIWRFFREVRHIWRKWLSRRTRGNGMTWEKFAAHPTATPAVATSDLTILGKVRRATLEEPAAVILHGGVCEGGEPTTSW